MEMPMRTLVRRLGGALLVAWPLIGCSTQRPTPVPRASHVDVPRYMGDWYVIASIPTPYEESAVNAVESYKLLHNGKIETSFRYRKETPAGHLKTMSATGYVRPDTNGAIWGMQFVWPIKAQYVISWVDADYHTVIVARDKRDYVWIMARSPTMPDPQYQQLVDRVAAMGYDVKQLRKVPQQWPEPPTQAR